MGWLGLKKRPAHEPEEIEEEPQPLPPLPPVLNLLVPDSAGVTSFRHYQFFTIEEAAELIQTLPSTSGLHAFWGLHQQPASDTNGEAMVLIRSAEGSPTVYVVSFVDLGSALSFARFEVKRGMNPNLLIIYWAEIVDVEAGDSGVRFFPDRPPAAGKPSFQPDSGARAAEPPQHAPPAPQPQLFESDEPEAAATAAPAPRQTVAPPDQAWEQEAEEEFEQFVAELETGAAAAPPPPVPEEPPRPESTAAATGLQPAAPEQLPAMAHAQEPQAPAADEEGHATGEARKPGAAEEEIDIEQEARAFVQEASRPAPPQPETAPETQVAETTQPAPQPAPDMPGPEPLAEPVVAAARPGAARAAEPAPREDGPTDTAQTAPDDGQEDAGEDLAQEVGKILRIKRWDKRDSPFRGFDSPPGRF